MAAAQVAKKLKDKRQQRTIEGIFKKVKNLHYIYFLSSSIKPQLSKHYIFQIDKNDTGSISLSEYFGIFSAHGIVVDKAETSRVILLAGEDGILSKDKFVKIVQGSNFFMKSFDKNKDGEVTEVKSFIIPI